MQIETAAATGHPRIMESGYRIAPVAWDTPEFAAAAAIRFRVFVDEQGTPADEEVDEHDAAAWHVLAVDAAGNPCGTGRLFAEDAGTARIGRMAVARDHRRNGCGTAIMRALMAEARSRGYRRIVLSAQKHAIPFYAGFGFAVESAEYMDCAIPHHDMGVSVD